MDRYLSVLVRRVLLFFRAEQVYIREQKFLISNLRAIHILVFVFSAWRVFAFGANRLDASLMSLVLFSLALDGKWLLKSLYFNLVLFLLCVLPNFSPGNSGCIHRNPA